MSKNFGRNNPDDAIPQQLDRRTAPATHAYTSATNYMRDWAGCLFVLGCFGLIPPFTPIGIVMMIFGGVVWLLCPVAAVNEAAMVVETQRTGNGFGAFLMALAVGIVIIVIAFAFATGIVEVMVTKGMVAP